MGMKVCSKSFLLLLAAFGLLATPVLGQGGRWVSVLARQPAEALQWDARVTAMEMAGELEQVSSGSESIVSGWFHERFQQRYRGLRVFGDHLLRHWHDGRVVLVNGRYHDDIRLDTTPAIGPVEARLVAERSVSNGAARVVGEPELLVYPSAAGLDLAYKLHVRAPAELQLVFVHAGNGRIIDSWNDLRNQTPVIGKGTGTWNDTKKMSSSQVLGIYQARDGMRPAVTYTVDVDGQYSAWGWGMINPVISAALDSDNVWQDGAVVDAHVYAGWTYDYYYKRFGRRGLDGSDIPIVSYVHFWPRSWGDHLYLNNAFWSPADRSINYGDGDGVTYNYFCSALDVVVHELTHGVTDFTSDLIYQNESGANNEAFSDIMAMAAEFFLEPQGSGRQRAEWLLGEDLYFHNNFSGSHPSATRSAGDPRSYNQPDHYSNRYRGREDNGGVHINSGIPTHAFYLFVEGGTNRTSGMTVDGIGLSNIENAEKIFYRAYTLYLTPSSNFSAARWATLQSATDLYGAGSNELQQLTAAWNAVGVH